MEFEGIRNGPVRDTREKLIQFKTNIDVAMSLLDQNGLGDWLADRLVEIGDAVTDEFPLRIDAGKDPFLDDRLRVANLPEEPQALDVENPVSGEKRQLKIALFRKAGEMAGARRGVSEFIKWLNYVTNNRVLTLAADLSGSVNLEGGSIWGHYDPISNPSGTRVKAAIQEAGNVSSAIGLIGQTASVNPDKFAGVWGVQWHLWRVYAPDVPAGACVEPAEPGQQVPDRSPEHPGRTFGTGNGRGCPARTSEFFLPRCGNCFREAR